MDFDVMNGKTRKRKTLTEVEKGVMLRTGSRTNILSITPEVASKTKKIAPTTLPTESGGERLKRAHTLLIKAQAETKDILTPILLRMERAKKIKTADQALQSIGVLLSYPHNMRIALGKGEYEDVLLISRKILLMSPGNVLSSAKVLIQVQKTALSIVEELRNKSLHILLGDDKEKEKEKEKNDNSFDNDNNNNNNNNNNNQDQEHVRNVPTIPELYRHVNLLFEIEGEEKQKQHLKNCFYRKLIKFGEEIQEYRIKYFYDSNVAVKQGKKCHYESLNESNHRRKDSKNNVHFDNNGSKGSYGSYDNNGIDLKSVKPTSYNITDSKTKKSNHGLGSSGDWMPSDITKNEKIMLKNLLNGKNNKNEKRGREINNNDLYDFKLENGKIDSKLLSDFGLSDDDGDDIDNDNDDNDDDDDNEEEERGREEEERKNVKFSDEKTNNTTLDENDISHPKIKKFKFFDSVEDEEITKKETKKKNLKDKEREKEKRSGGIYLIGQASENHFSELFCARVRLLYILRVVRAVDAWTPVLTQ